MQTAIDDIRIADNTPADAPLYDLQGRKVTSAQKQKGIYIKNGKKVLVR